MNYLSYTSESLLKNSPTVVRLKAVERAIDVASGFLHERECLSWNPANQALPNVKNIILHNMTWYNIVVYSIT